jgi:hypothetical protein
MSVQNDGDGFPVVRSSANRTYWPLLGPFGVRSTGWVVFRDWLFPSPLMP